MTHDENEAESLILNIESAYFMARYFGQVSESPVQAMQAYIMDNNNLDSPDAHFSSRAVKSAIDFAVNGE